MNQPKRLMVMAGGTGGHVFRGWRFAHHLMDQGWQVRWLEPHQTAWKPTGAECTVLRFDFIRISGLRGKGLKPCCWHLCVFLNAWRQAAHHHEAL